MPGDLLDVALAARAKAHAPYSKFRVGAAMRDERGQIHGGCNIENAAYPQGWCAECSAIAALVMAGGKRIVEVAVVGTGDALCTPCGGCRQKIREFASADVSIHCHGESGGLIKSFTLQELLPFSFGPENLV
jgi:cytidine deaminase